jgi:hypothetical protein
MVECGGPARVPGGWDPGVGWLAGDAEDAGGGAGAPQGPRRAARVPLGGAILGGWLPPARVFLSSLVLRHLDGSGKRNLFARLLDRPEPGGALLFADVMELRTERARRHFATAWEEIRRRS